MKRILSLLFSFSFFTLGLFAEESFIPCEKTYVHPDQIHFTESSLFVQMNDLWIQPEAIHVDANGLYFNSLQPVPGPWQCKKRECREWNSEWEDICHKCKTPRRRHYA